MYDFILFPDQYKKYRFFLNIFLGTPLPYLGCPVSPVTHKQGELTCDLLENPFPTLIAPQLPIDKKSMGC